MWGQKLIYLLDHITADGFVFRVDMRLRPWGDGSALAISHTGLEKYLSQHGREWERYAWIKARVITGEKSWCRTHGNVASIRFSPLCRLFCFRCDA